MNPTAHLIIWIVWMVVAIAVNFRFVGMRFMVAFFPEGWRPWMPFAQYGSLAFFAAAVLWHPF